MKPKRFLFFPVEVGIAHMARSLALAEKLAAQKHQVAMAIPKSKQKIFSGSPIELIDINETSKEQDLHVLESFKDIDTITGFVKNEYQIIRQYKPDYCVVDFRLSALISAKQLNIPIFFITGSGGLPYGTYIPNLGMPEYLFKPCRPLLGFIIDHVKLNFFSILDQASKKTGKEIRIKELVKEIKFIIPEIPAYLPSDNTNLKKIYCGPLNWNGFLNQKPKWITQIKPDGKTIYLSFGGTCFDKKILIGLASELIKAGFRVIASSSSIADPKEFIRNKNLFVERYLPGFEISKKVDLVICHGGYGTLTDASFAGVPVVTIPFNPDQMLHSFRYQELGLGLTTAKFKPEYLKTLIKWDWLAFEKIGQKVNLNNAVKLAVNILNNKDKYMDNIKKFKHQLEEYNNINLQLLTG